MRTSIGLVCAAAVLALAVPRMVRAASADDAAGGGESAAVAALRQRVGAQGYLLREVRWDAVLKQSWAVLESVGHPERPYVSVLVPLDAKDRTAAVVPVGAAPGFSAGPVVRAGDRVVLWSEERNLHLQLTAVAEQSGQVGERIRLHVLGVSMGWEQTTERLTGIVRGAASVEMVQ